MTELSRTPRYETILSAADALARQFGHDYVGVEHLMLAILDDPAAVPTQVLSGRVDPAVVAADIRALLDTDGYKTPGIPLPE